MENEEMSARVIRLEKMVKQLEADFWSLLGRSIAMESGLFATAGEPDPALRPTLLEDLLMRAEANQLTRPTSDEQLDRMQQAQSLAHQAVQRAFERALVRPEFRMPPPRRPPSGQIR